MRERRSSAVRNRTIDGDLDDAKPPQHGVGDVESSGVEDKLVLHGNVCGYLS